MSSINQSNSSSKKSFEINRSEHKVAHKLARTQKAIRSLASRASTKGESEAAKSKLKGPQNPLLNSYQFEGQNVDEAHWNPVTKEIQSERPSSKEIESLAAKARTKRKVRTPVGTSRRTSSTFKPSSREEAQKSQKDWDEYWEGMWKNKSTQTEAKDHEYSMARTELHIALDAIKKLQKKLKGEGNIEAWVQSKITRAADYLGAASDYIESGEHNHVEEETILEREMTADEKRKEKKLKQKYDDSEMKQNMIDQYGEERGTQIYFAKIRKMAMEETQLNEFLGTGKVVAGRTLPNRAGGPNLTQAGTVQKVFGVTVPGSFKQGVSRSDVQRHDAANPKQAILPRNKPPTTSQMISGKGGHFVTGVNSNKPNPPQSAAKVSPSQGSSPRPNTLSGVVSKLQQRKQATDAAIKQLNQSFEYTGSELEEAKLSRTAKRAARAGKPGYDAEGKPKPKGKVRAWDMDETLMRNDPKKIRVHVVDKQGKRVQSLTNQEFNVHKLDKDKGHSYDFGEFKSSEKFSKASTPNKSMIKKLKKQVRRGKPVHIVTARGSFDDQPKFAKHLRRHGIEIDPGKGKGGRHVHVHRAGDMPGSDIGEKKVKIVKGLMKKHGTSGAEMYDDAAKVHRAFKKSGLKVKTKMVQPNSSDVTQARSFKENFEPTDIYVFILERLMLEGFANTNDEAINLLNTFNDELLTDLITESVSIMSQELNENQSLKIDYVSPYRGRTWSSTMEEEIEDDTELTPYEYWKSFIGDTQSESVTGEVEEEILEEETKIKTSYDYWKKYLSE